MRKKSSRKPSYKQKAKEKSSKPIEKGGKVCYNALVKKKNKRRA